MPTAVMAVTIFLGVYALIVTARSHRTLAALRGVLTRGQAFSAHVIDDDVLSSRR